MPKAEKPPAGLLLDTHVLLRYAAGEKLAPKTVRSLEKAADRSELYLSAISLFEIVTLDRGGRIKLRPTPREWWEATLLALSVTVLEVTTDIAFYAAQFETMHGDPADRIILATAYAHGLTLATGDTKLVPYAPKARVAVLAC